MDYESVDRAAIEYLAACDKNGTRFFLSERGTATDIIENARRYRDPTEAYLDSCKQNSDYAWHGFDWRLCRYIPATKALLIS